jgi:hypothetical protein
MTKISCTKCCGRLGEVLAAEVASPHDNSQVAVSPDLALLRANLSDLTLLKAHLEECAECAGTLSLLRATRSVMQGFKAPPVPNDLRERIRAAIEEAPTPQTTPAHETNDSSLKESTPVTTDTTASSPVSIASPRVPIRHENSENSEMSEFWENCVRFFRRPSNVAWTSGLALAAFCVLLVARPERRNDILSPSLKATQIQTPQATKTTEQAAKPPRNAPTPQSHPTPPAKPNGPPSAPLPGLTVFPGSAPLPLWGNDPFASPPSSTAPESKELPLVSSAPTSRTPQDKKTHGMASVSVPHASVAPNDAASVLSASSRTASGAIGNTERETSSPRLTEPIGASRTLPTPIARITSKPERSSELAASPMSAARATSGNFSMQAQKTADADNSDAQKARAPLMAQRDIAPIKRFITGKIKAPQDIGWGQVSVSLPGDLRFEDGAKVRIVWRGAVSIGETIDVGFTVVAPRGEYTVRLSLQTVQQGDAQTVMVSSLPLELR